MNWDEVWNDEEKSGNKCDYIKIWVWCVWKEKKEYGNEKKVFNKKRKRWNMDEDKKKLRKKVVNGRWG